MPGIPTGLSFPGIEDISAFEFVYGRGVEPGACILECLPVDSLASTPGTMTITYDTDSFPVPDMCPVEQWLKQADDGTGFRMHVKLLDHRRRWARGAISGLYNLRLADGTVYTPTKKEPRELAELCLQAMGESAYDVSRMPTGVYPPILWDNVNPAQALDFLCRYVGCEVTGGERQYVVIWPKGTGSELPTGGEYINPPYEFLNQDYPSEILLQGGLTIWQGKLKLKGHVIQNGEAKTLTPVIAADTNWPREQPFSIPILLTTEPRQDAFESEFRQFPVVSLADGANNLPLAPFLITKPHQYILSDHRLDTFVALDTLPQNMPARVEGKFFPYGDDADSHTEIKPYTGRFLIRQAGNIVEFPYPVWKTGTTGEMEEPDLYLLTAFKLQRVNRDGRATFFRSRALGGGSGAYVLQRHELFFGVKLTYGGDKITITGFTSTEGPANTEAQIYLDIFQTILTAQKQLDIEWLEVRPLELDGNIAQVRIKGRVNDSWTTRASRNSEFDLYGPTAMEQRIHRRVANSLEVACP